MVDEVKGLKEIPSYAWIITSGNRSYIFSGSPSQAPGAKKIVATMPRSAGNTIRMKRVV